MTFEAITSEFIKHISKLSPTGIINGIIAGKYIKDTLKYAYQKLKQKQFEGIYYFTPKPEDLETIQLIENSDLYRRTEQILGIHPLFSILRLGIYVDHLNEKGRKSKVREVRNKIYQKYKEQGLKVLEIASTGELSYTLENLNDYYQRFNCDKIKVCKLFDYILSKWKSITLFIKKEDTIEQIEDKIKSIIKDNYPYFLIFSYGSASINTCRTIAKLDNEEFFRKNKYLPQIRRKRKHDDYGWIIENIEKDIFDFSKNNLNQ